MKITDIISKIRDLIKNTVPDAKAILYGSQARGDARPDSDIDILVLLPDSFSRQEFVTKKLDISGKLYDLSLASNIDISPLILGENMFQERKTPFTVNVINEGIRLL